MYNPHAASYIRPDVGACWRGLLAPDTTKPTSRRNWHWWASWRARENEQVRAAVPLRNVRIWTTLCCDALQFLLAHYGAPFAVLVSRSSTVSTVGSFRIPLRSSRGNAPA
jgi:hypothetical protein